MIKIENLTKIYDENKILDDISITFEEGIIYGIVGKNGSGKSVLLKTICGFIRPDKGEILFDNINIVKKQTFPPETGAMFENSGFIPNISGFENLKLLASINNIISEEEILKSVDIVNLKEDINKKYYKYSLGMRKKLGICQAIMENQKYIILDEPFNGIDDESLKKIKIQLNKIKENKIIIISTHIKEDIEKLCDEVYKISNGKINKI